VGDGETLAMGKLPMELLQALLARYTQVDDRLVVGPRVGEDVAVVDMGDRYLVIKTDPITFATDQIGWYAVHVNANDIATSGARPRWMLTTVLLPERSTTAALVEDIFQQLHQACEGLGITLAGGHTEVAWGLERPIVVGVLLGEVAHDRLLCTADARVGDQILLVKAIPIEGTAIIARERREELLQRGFSADMLTRASDAIYDPGISVVEVAGVAAEHPGVHAMHDPTEGGVATGLHELAHAARAGVRFYRERVPLLPEGEALCRAYGLDPMGVIASGALLVAAAPEHAPALIQRYENRGIPCVHIADLVPAEQGCTMEMEQGNLPLPRYDSDEITRLF
jgi:hydrogenase expression/formation protein HypE